MSDKVMNFNEFSKKTPLQDPKNALKGDNVDPQKKSAFVDQVKTADLSQNLEKTEPDYTKTVENPINEDLTAVNQQMAALLPKIQQARETLQKAQSELDKLISEEDKLKQQAAQLSATTQTTTVAGSTPQVPNQAGTPQAAVQQPPTGQAIGTNS